MVDTGSKENSLSEPERYRLNGTLTAAQENIAYVTEYLMRQKTEADVVIDLKVLIIELRRLNRKLMKLNV